MSEYSGLSARYNARKYCNARDKKNSNVARTNVRTVGSTIKSGPTDLAVRSSKAGLKTNDPHHKILSCKGVPKTKGKGCMAGNSKFPDKTKRRRKIIEEKNNLMDMANKWEPCMFGTEGFEKTVIDMDYCRVWAPILV